MELHSAKILTTKTGRVFYSGNSTNPYVIWICLHGYAQLAPDFLEKFSVLRDEGTLLLAPEGLHRFYTKGFSGRVGASWMTKEDREADIRDYITWLETVYENFILPHANATVIALGFSQGGATVSRWLEKSSFQVNHAVLYASTFPLDVIPSGKFSKRISGKIVFVAGSEDEFISEDEQNKQVEILGKSGKPIERIWFEGRHEIDENVLVRLRALLLQN